MTQFIARLAHQARRDESTAQCHPEQSERSQCPTREILRFAQDDTRKFSIPVAFLPTLVGLLNEYVGINGLAPP